jgi:triphosphoribosyl-dephospho-CoA synthase
MTAAALCLQSPVAQRRIAPRPYCGEIARAAVLSLYDELSLYPKPGLVSLADNGSHDDMDAATFMRSLFSLRRYFTRIAAAGAAGAPFTTLQQLGIAAEHRMLAATGGVNTHRGAIFSLGMLCAAAGRCQALGLPATPTSVRAMLLQEWGAALAQHAAHADAACCATHGLAMAARHGASGAREEAALGLPSVFLVALPALRQAHAETGCWDRARIQALFALMAHVSDTNVYYRGGAAGAALVCRLAGRFVERGGVGRIDWLRYATACHRIFTRRKLSPGGAADLLAAACLLHRLDPRMQAGAHG